MILPDIRIKQILNIKNMLSRMKFSVVLVVAIFMLTAFITNMFAKTYHSDKDFTCCKGDQLYIHHYYTIKVFWAEAGSNYTIEPIGKPSPGGCNIQCSE